MTFPKGDHLAGAIFSPCERYRYRLWRREPGGGRTLLWIMLNPSTADEAQLDPTLRRCRAFTKAWGFTNWEVCNLFAWRATKPAAMLKAADPVGPMNDVLIDVALSEAAEVVLAWGARGSHLGRDRTVLDLVRQAKKPTWRLGDPVGDLRQPAHPLYLPASILAQRIF